MSVRGVLLAIATVAAIVLSACGGDDGGTTSTPTTQPAHDIDLTTATPALRVLYPPNVLKPGWPETVAGGDFNGDGETDLLIGAPFADGPDGSRLDAGEAYVLFGPLSGDIDLSAANSADVVVLGAEEEDNLGGGVAAGDLNGDGIDDLIIGAPASNGLVDVRTDMGEAYVIFGRADLAGTIDILAQAQDVTIQPAEGFATLGRTFAVGDLNGDGTDDLIAGAPYGGRQAGTPPGGERTTVGEVYAFYGGPDFKGMLTVAKHDEDLRFAGVVEFDTFGVDVAAADVNGDGRLDVIVGTSGYDSGGGANVESGAVFVFFGSADPPDLRTETEADVVLTGPAGARLGTSVAATDLDGDGAPEIAASAPAAFDGSGALPGAGRLYYVYGLPAGAASVDLDTCGCAAVLYGAAEGESFPSAVSSSEDGRWLLLGSPAGSVEGRAGSGVVDVLSSPSGDAGQAPDAARILGATGDGLGAVVALADLDGNGPPEALVLGSGPDGSATAVLFAISPTN